MLARLTLRLSLLACLAGCSEPPVGNEWFIVVAKDLSEAQHELFAEELRYVTDHIAHPGDPVHVLVGRGSIAFSGHAPWPAEEDCCDDALPDVITFLHSSVYLEGLEDCQLHIDTLPFDMRRLRESDLPVRTVLVGSVCRHPARDKCCQIGHHSLLDEVRAKRFHPEFIVTTRTRIEMAGW